jgi:hypothetical protein
MIVPLMHSALNATATFRLPAVTVLLTAKRYKVLPTRQVSLYNKNNKINLPVL